MRFLFCRSANAGARAGVVRALLLAALAWAPAVAAQDSTAVPDAWDATAQLSFTNASGNRDVTVFTTGFTLRHRRTERYAFELNVRARYGSSEGETDIENYLGDLKLDLAPARPLSPFVYTTAERDPVRRLDARVNTGAGARYKLNRADGRGDASISVALLHSYEATDAGALAPGEDPTTTNARWSFQLDGQQQIREDIAITHKTTFEPVAREFGDYLLKLRTTLKVVVTTRIALSISHEFDRESVTPPDVEEHDQLVNAGILIEL